MPFNQKPQKFNAKINPVTIGTLLQRTALKSA